MPRKWKIAQPVNVDAYVEQYRIHPAIAQCLVNRGIGVEEADRFINVKEEYYDPFLLPDMEVAVNRLKQAKERGEKVLVYRDYDVDGTMGGAILVKALSKYGINVSHFAPNRFRHGYGLHKDALKELLDQGYNLVVTVDCGISSIAEIEYAKSRGVDVIVTDHHEPGEILPNAVAVINPKRKDSRYPFKEICGAAVAWKLAQALLGEDCHDLIDLVAVATVADVVPLLDENRVIVRYGLVRLNSKDRNLGIDQLAEVAGVNEIDSFAIGYIIGPRINAVGRLGDSNPILELFLTNSPIKARQLASIADQINKKRQEMVDRLVEHAEELIQTQWSEAQNIIVLASDAFHEGVIGIVAARLLEKYQRPTIVIATKDGIGKASCRSIKPVHLYETLTAVKELLVKYGGHEKAAGFTIEANKIDDFRHAINEKVSWINPEVFETPIVIDAVVNLEEVNDYLVEQMRTLAPFGEANPSPCFAVKQVEVLDLRLLSEGKHVRLDVFDGVTRQAIGFNFGEWASGALQNGVFVDIAFRPSVNEFAGERNVQLEIIDIKISEKQEAKHYENGVDIDSRALALKLFGSEAERSRFEEGKYDGIEDALFFHTKVAGVSFDNRQEIIRKLDPGDILYLRREPEKFTDENGKPLDENAISVYTEENEHVGFLNRRLAAVLAPVIDAGTSYIASVDSVTGDDTGHRGLNIIVQKIVKEDERRSIAPSIIKPKPLFMMEDDPLSSSAMQEIRRALIGHHEYHEKQKEAIEASLNGESIMVVMGTGRGKSAIFQSVAAYDCLIYGKKALILYPIKALLNDQYDAISRKLSPLGIRVGVASGILSSEQRQELFENEYAYDIILGTPEFVLYHQEKLRTFLDHVGLVVLDECHHLADDRSGYRQIHKLVRDINARTILLSATVNDEVLRRVQEELPVHRVIVDDYARSNLRVVDHRNHIKKEQPIWELLSTKEKIVIYCNSRTQTVSLAERIRNHFFHIGRQNEVAYYNADLKSDIRLAIERAFARGDLKVVVATSAFGEGIDIPDIRHVIHYHLPLSMTAFMQQSGRAGRDGKTAYVHLVFGRIDERINRSILDGICPDRETLLSILKTIEEVATDNQVIQATNEEIQKHMAEKYDYMPSLEAIDVALRIFEDLDLISVEWNRGRLIKVQPLKRVSLHDAVIYSEALRERRAYEDYVAWIREAPVDEIEAAISRPLFPKVKENVWQL